MSRVALDILRHVLILVIECEIYFLMQAAEEANGVQGVRKRKRSEAGGARKKGDGKRRHVERGMYQPYQPFCCSATQ